MTKRIYNYLYIKSPLFIPEIVLRWLCKKASE